MVQMHPLTTKKSILGILERLLNQSRQDKLMYLNAADRMDAPTYKRFLNQQALQRNNFFHQLSTALSNHGIDQEEVLLNRPDIRQLMMTSPKRDKSNPFIKCIAQDDHFRMLLMEIMAIDTIDFNLNIYQKILDKLDYSQAENERFKEELAEKTLRTEGLF